ncbi:hypothetical protein ACLOJK_022675, partial [Asimina triloba]
YMIFGAPPEHPYGAPSPSPRPAVMAADGELQLNVCHGCRTHHRRRQLHLPDVSSATDSGRQRRPRADARPPPSAISSIQQISITDLVATHDQPTNPSTVLLPSRSSGQAPLIDASQASSGQRSNSPITSRRNPRAACRLNHDHTAQLQQLSQAASSSSIPLIQPFSSVPARAFRSGPFDPSHGINKK